MSRKNKIFSEADRIEYDDWISDIKSGIIKTEKILYNRLTEDYKEFCEKYGKWRVNKLLNFLPKYKKEKLLRIPSDIIVHRVLDSNDPLQTIIELSDWTISNPQLIRLYLYLTLRPRLNYSKQLQGYVLKKIHKLIAEASAYKMELIVNGSISYNCANSNFVFSVVRLLVKVFLAENKNLNWLIRALQEIKCGNKYIDKDYSGENIVYYHNNILPKVIKYIIHERDYYKNVNLPIPEELRELVADYIPLINPRLLPQEYNVRRQVEQYIGEKRRGSRRGTERKTSSERSRSHSRTRHSKQSR
jgi:hypothetical protein